MKSSGNHAREHELLFLVTQISKEFYRSVPVSRVVVVGIFIPYLGRERSDANRGPGSESCNTTCRTEYNAAERELRKLHVVAKLPCRAAFSAASQAFSWRTPPNRKSWFMGLMIPQAGDTFELFGAATALVRLLRSGASCLESTGRPLYGNPRLPVSYGTALRIL
jgi:hypothetical protein